MKVRLSVPAMILGAAFIVVLQGRMVVGALLCVAAALTATAGEEP